jgi:hypothetical protein
MIDEMEPVDDRRNGTTAGSPSLVIHSFEDP